MSTYEFYEFIALDRILDLKEQAALRAISSRAEISATRFWNEYSFGSFKGNPVTFLEGYFDAHVYFANWGTYTFMLGLPIEAVDPELCRRYLPGELTHVSKKAGRIVLSLTRSEDGADYVNDENWMSQLLPLRGEIIAGDLRPLYLGWLAAISDEHGPIEGDEPPVPAGLKLLTSAQRALVEFLRIPRALVKEAANASPPAVKSAKVDVEGWVKTLTPARMREIILKLLTAEPGVLKSRLMIEVQRGSDNPIPTAPGSRHSDALLQAVRGDTQ